MIIKGIAIIPENHPVRIVNAILERMDRHEGGCHDYNLFHKEMKRKFLKNHY